MYLHTTKGKDGQAGIEYRIYTDVYEFAENELQRFPKTYRTKYRQKWLQIGCGFDIETTTVMQRSYMYHWQFSWGRAVVLGRTWSAYEVLTDILQNYLDRHDARIICWVANLSYEFSFIQYRYPIDKVFARDERHPIKCNQGRIQYRDCLYLSGQGGLANLAKNYTTTQKAVGDIDHRKIRNTNTALTAEETGYCIADVAILSEWSDYCFNRWCNHKGACKIPLTATGIVRDAIHDACTDLTEVIEDVRVRYPADKETYNFMMRWLFRGGYTHANVYHAGDRLTGIIGADFTSSYPAVMLHDAYPVSMFLPCRLDTDGVHITDKALRTDCVWMIVKLYDVNSTTMHHIESAHKIIDGDGIQQDNGRMIRAEWCTVALTEIDYLIYEKFYTWSAIEVKAAYSATKGKLPDYVIKPLMTAYKRKQELKRAGLDETPDYRNAKAIVNSYYGCMVQRLNFDDIIWTQETGWDTVETDKPYDDMRAGAILLPQWGIWVTAWARFHLLSTVHRLDPDLRHNSVVYCDTDSIYMIDSAENRKVIDQYNELMSVVNRSLPEEFSDIGCYDWIDHGALWDFKTIGAKRYVKYDRARQLVRVTVAGLRIGSYEEMLCEDEETAAGEEYIDFPVKIGTETVHKVLSVDAVFDSFKDHLLLDRTVSMKTTTHYCDKPYEEDINGVLMQEMSGCCITDIPFEIKMSDLYLYLIDDVHKGRRKPIV